MTDKRAFSTKAPFGVATKRFEKIGFHPELDLSGAMKREITKAGPGSYNPKFYSCKSKSKVCSWKYKVELEEFSKYLGFRNANILAQRNFDKTLRGPGTNDTNEALFKKQSNAVLENIGFGSGPRFRQGRKREQKPSPDTYFRHYTNKFITKKSFSKLPTFEYDGVEDRFKSRTPSYQLPPNLYNINDGKNTTDITKKVVSHLKGPYDLFSGSRSEDLSSETPDYFFINPSDVDVLLHSRWKKRCGLFLQCTRFPSRPTVRHMLNDVSLCYRDPNAPGPPHYNVPWGQGIFPHSWKVALVQPMPKKGKKSLPSNYHPYSLISVVSEVTKKSINFEVLKYLEANKIIPNKPYVIISDRQWDLLAYFTHVWNLAMEKYGESRTVALNNSNAFDRVWDQALLRRLIAD